MCILQRRNQRFQALLAAQGHGALPKPSRQNEGGAASSLAQAPGDHASRRALPTPHEAREVAQVEIDEIHREEQHRRGFTTRAHTSSNGARQSLIARRITDGDGAAGSDQPSEPWRARRDDDPALARPKGQKQVEQAVELGASLDSHQGFGSAETIRESGREHDDGEAGRR